MSKYGVPVVLILFNGICLSCNQGNFKGSSAMIVDPDPIATSTPNSLKTLTFVNGLSDQPVVGASVSINNKEYFTNDEGQIVAVTDQNDPIDILAKRYLNRVTSFLGDPKFTLWPSKEPDYEARFLYSDERLFRPNAGTHTVWVGEDIASDKNASAKVDQCLTATTYAVRGKIQFKRTNDKEGANIKITVEPDNPDVRNYNAISYIYILNDFTIASNDIVLKSLSILVKQNTLVHELGHFMGLGHSNDVGDVMCPNKMDWRTIDFSSREMDTLFMMTLRRPGQIFPDNDRVLESKNGKGKLTILYKCY